MQWHAVPPNRAAEELKTDPSAGLTAIEAEKRLRQYGKNRLEAGKKKSLIRKFLEQFANFMVIILLIAAVISFATAIYSGEGDYIEPIIILVIVILNAVIGVIQENRAEHAIEALKKMSAPHARIIREGRTVTVRAEDIVPGDVLLLEAGDLVPADARLMDSTALKAEESKLTGESVPVSKDAAAVLRPDTAAGDQKNMVFAMSTVTAGHGCAIVTATGMDTSVGRIAGMIREQETPQTPLQLRLARTGRILGIGALLICAVIFVMGILQKTPIFDSFMLSVSLAVAAIPEGLPAIVTIVLSIGVQRMARRNAVIRRLPAVETLGSATVICSDKTGTLTQNKMTVTAACTADGMLNLNSEEAHRLLAAGALCCNASVQKQKGHYTADGEPTENAIVLAAAQGGTDLHALNTQYKRVKEIPFTSSSKRMTTIHRTQDGKFFAIVKGAPDLLLRSCTGVLLNGKILPMSEARRQSAAQLNARLASRALRVIAVACKPLSGSGESAENGLALIGLIGMEDPPRREAKEAVRICKAAGIIPIMITGDHIATAKAVAEQIGILEKGCGCVTGAELDQMGEDELAENVKNIRVFARVSPEHKVRIVKALRAKGEIVAMTGDGVNDAPALKAADIGCAMGRSGTDVAKGASDMILTDDNFATIVSAVREGRGIYDNIKKSVHFLLSCNIGEILVILAAFLMGLPSPLAPIQLLWVNLVTDALPAMALGVEKADPNIMRRKPVSPGGSMFAGGLGFDIALEGIMIGAVSLLAYVFGHTFFDLNGATGVGGTMAFGVLSLSELVHAFNMRSDRSLLRIGPFSNRKMVGAFAVCAALQVVVMMIPPLAAVFGAVTLTAAQWGAVWGFALIPLFVMEIAKWFGRKKEPNEEE